MKPVLSVITITYDHEAYISKCIEGVLAQKTNFPIEYIIAEDCSTDNTRAICEEYVRKNPEIIHLITSDSNVGYIKNELRAMIAARGKYIAYCEGDDYWTDPQKLQKQVDFLESHPEYSVCFHRCKHWNPDNDSVSDDLCSSLFINGETGTDISLDMFFGKWITQPLTMVFRTDALDLQLYDEYRHYRDMHQIYHLLKEGKGYLFSFYGGVRIIHDGGLASKLSTKKQCIIGVTIAEELYYRNKDKATKHYLKEMLQWYLYSINIIGEGRYKRSFQLFFLTGDIKKLIRNLTRK